MTRIAFLTGFWIAAGLAAAQSWTVTAEGEGYIRLQQAGRIVLAKTVRLIVRDGRLAHPSGAEPLPMIAARSFDTIEISADGLVTSVAASRRETLGRLTLVRLPQGALVEPQAEFFVSSARAIPDASLRLRVGSTTPTRESARPSASIGSTTIALRAQAQVTGDQIRLSDIAELSGLPAAIEKLGQVVVGSTPAIGVERILDLPRLEARLRAAGINPREVRFEGAPVVRVRRESQLIPIERFHEAAMAHLRKRFGSAAEIAPLVREGESWVRPGPLRFEVEATELTASQARLTIAVYVKDERTVSRQLTYRLTGSVGVRIGQMVKIAMKLNGIVVEMNGRVKRPGLIGETIEVETPTGAVISGTLVASDRVEVQP